MNPYCSLAKKAIEVYIKTGKIIKLPLDLPPDFYNRKAGVFVSLHKGDFLRGCIGTSQPTQQNTGQEIIDNAIAAAHDPRFTLLQPPELKHLSYEVYVLEKPEPIDNPDKLNPKKYGLIVKSLSSARSALLLPDLEDVETVQQQFEICCQKAGINSSKEKLLLFRFKAKKYTDSKITKSKV